MERPFASRILAWIAPRSLLDGVVKGTALGGLLVLSNFVFSIIYFGTLPFSGRYYIWNALFVGTPWAVLFYLLVLAQTQVTQNLRRQGRYDEMTGLLNRGAFIREVEAVHYRSGVIALIDMDHFRKVNDRLGHAMGDHCLKLFAARLAAAAREGDVIGRFGGEEFAVFLPRASPGEARAIVANLTQPLALDDPKTCDVVPVTMSAGAAETRFAVSVTEALIRADRSRYCAKDQGRNRIVFWHEIGAAAAA